MNTIELTDDYFNSFLDHEDYFRSKYENSYYSRPVLYDKDGAILAVAPWGEPGYTPTIIFPYAHYISITALKKKNIFSKPQPMSWIYKMEDLVAFLKKEYEVTEFENEPISYLKVQMPDLNENKKEYERFWSLLYDIPTVQG